MMNNIDEVINFFHTVTSTEYEERISKAVQVIQDAGQLVFIGIGHQVYWENTVPGIFQIWESTASISKIPIILYGRT